VTVVRPPQPAAPPEAVPSGFAARRLVELRWESETAGTRLVARFDGPLALDRVRSSRIGGESPRQVVKLLGMAGLPSAAPWHPATPELAHVRAGFHRTADRGELHLVLDLAGPDVRVQRVEASGDELRIELAALPASR
jgi:hypothetical protein